MNPVTQHFDPFSVEYLSDPYRYFENFRAEAPVFYSEELDYWVVSRYEDVKRILRDSETFSNRITLDPVRPWSAEVLKILEDGGYRARAAMVGTDPPYHTRAKKLMGQAFTPRHIAELEPRIRRLTVERLESWPRSGRVDLVQSLTYDLPALALFMLLGVPDEDVDRVKVGAGQRLLLVWGHPTDQEQAELARGVLAFWRHCEELVEHLARQPGTDLTSELIRIRGGDDSVLSLQEIASLIFGLLFAGHETTTAFITNAVRQLLRHEGAWEELRANPDRMGNAIEELLRLDSSGIAWRRLATRDTEIGGIRIPAGSRVLILLGSANHDQEKFACPHQLELGRANAKDHLAFGFGIHYCLGAALARLEAKVVLEELARRFPDLRMVADQPLSFSPNLSFRGPLALWVEWSGADR